MSAPSALLSLISFSLWISPVLAGLHRGQCLTDTQAKLDNNTLSLNDTSIFATDTSGNLLGSREYPVLTIFGCGELCGGPGTGWYDDAPSRILTWFLPGIILVSSMQYAPIGKKKILMLFHVFGDPIHSMWSLLSKLDDWNKCYVDALSDYGAVPQTSHSRSSMKVSQLPVLRAPSIVMKVLVAATKVALAVKEGALVVWRFEPFNPLAMLDKELQRSIPTTMATIRIVIRELQAFSHKRSNPHIDPLAPRTPCQCSFPNHQPWMRQISGEIVDLRTSGTSQSWLAITLYLLGIVANFVDKLGGTSLNPSGGKLAPPMLLSWVLPNMLLSNIVGQFNARNCIRIVARLDDSTKGLHEAGCSGFLPAEDSDLIANLKNLPWSGGIYTCQLERPMLDWSSSKNSGFNLPTRRSSLLVFIAALPVLISFGIAFWVLYSAPTYLNCRHFGLIVIILAWFHSPIITRYMMAFEIFGLSKRSRWIIVMIKDALLGSAILVSLIFSSVGWGNSCRCWAGYFHSNIAVVLKPDDQFSKNDNVIYPCIVAGCLLAQYMVFKVKLYQGRHGVKSLRWKEEEIVESLKA